MSEDQFEEEERDEELEQESGDAEALDRVIHVSGMYETWFLDYASYVILERAVPHMNDGLKPVQRRILHSMRELEDGRYNKVANVVGNTMKYHPHGDASIADAMVQLGQKDLLIDTQGNWGNIYTGDGAAASRYIEARLTKFALAVVFNAKTTQWVNSYDGRNKEPVTLPIKFPLLLAQGVEGIAVGMACKILPHNFNELIDASIKYLKGQKFSLVPDFITGGTMDASNYNDGLRGGKIKVRARIDIVDKKTLKIFELPFGSTTSSLIDSIVKANDKGKIKVKKIEDNTASEVEILVHLTPGVSPDKMVDALYAFTDCEISISPNSAVIENDKPRFAPVSDILKVNTDQTVSLLKQELEIALSELENKWHFASLEKIFIEQKIYVEFDGKTYEEAIALTFERLQPHIKHLVREVSEDDVKRLLEIKMRRITKHDADEADKLIESLEAEMDNIKHHLAHLVEYAIDYYKNIKAKFGKGKERKTEVRNFDTIVAAKVAVANEKLMVNYKEGFVGYGLKRGEGEFVSNCSDIDDVIAIRKDGTMVVSKVSEKAFLGKDLLHVAVWKKGDTRTTYNLVYEDGRTGPIRVKRFQVTSITRDKEYPLTKGTPKSKIIYLTVNPNGEAELINVSHKAIGNIKKLKFDYDFAELDIKGRGAGGNILTKYPVAKIVLKEEGVSTLPARKIYYDESVRKLNADGRGEFLGEFKGDDKIIEVGNKGSIRLLNYDLSNHFEEGSLLIQKWDPKKPFTAVYYDGEKGFSYIKRFEIENTEKRQDFIFGEKDQFSTFSFDYRPVLKVIYDKRSSNKEEELIDVEEFIGIKGIKAAGKRLSTNKVKTYEWQEPLVYEEPEVDEGTEDSDEDQSQITFEWDVD